MLQLENNTPFSAEMYAAPGIDGVDALYVLVKATYDIEAALALCRQQQPVFLQDEFSGEPASSSLRYGSEYSLGKAASDVVLIGHAWAPDEKATPCLDVSLSVGDDFQHTVRVFGDRVRKGSAVSEPSPFVAMPLVYERAYGGYSSNDPNVFDARNPVGTGFIDFAEQQNDTHEVRMPNLEHPDQPVSRMTEHPEPMGFGAIPPAWRAREQFSGTYDEHWRVERAPYLPDDFDGRFFNMAHPRLIYPGFLQGGETVTLTNARRQGPLCFDLPDVEPTVISVISGHEQELDVRLETLLIEPDDQRFSITWCAQTTPIRSVLSVEKVSIYVMSSYPKTPRIGGVGKPAEVVAPGAGSRE